MRPILHPDLCVKLPPRLCATVGDYAIAWSCGASFQDWTVPFDKRDKATHRFDIADTHGRLSLTVPIRKPESSHCHWDEIGISDHGEWWDVHRVALESAYGRTPYFEFYIDRFLPMLTSGVSDRYPRLRDLALAWDHEIRDILGIGSHLVTDDKITSYPALPESIRPYRQIRADRLGFIPSLSILDLIFNLGPEAQLHLNGIAKEIRFRH